VDGDTGNELPIVNIPFVNPKVLIAVDSFMSQYNNEAPIELNGPTHAPNTVDGSIYR
jgi:hypothetical protein